MCLYGRLTFERIHNTKEQIEFYERVENHKAKERMFKSFNERIFQVNTQMQGKIKHLSKGFICIKVLGFALLILSHLF